ncbi:CheR family methyltransferase [Loktanella sp. DJP18]|uniref:CheR family methyltransferase n=1 Tax=Loktanella sp. DJP18 TaxID=3409788 RepID=UPI003BB7684E
MTLLSRTVPIPGATDPMLACDTQSYLSIAAILHRETGINLPQDNSSLVVARLIKHLRRLNLATFPDFVNWINDPAHADDRARMISALTTNTTHFYREGYHFDVFVRDLLPRLKMAADRGERIRLWSAGCSSGEEVYSLAATLLHHWPEAGSVDLRILATDISADVLRTAQVAEYPRERLDPVPEAIRALMLRDAAPGAPMVRMPAAIRDLVTVRYMNFVEPWPTRGPFQAILCRNVAIYMDEAIQTRVFTGLADMLAPQGLLFIGHSERLPPSLSHRLTLIDRTTFRHI